MTYLLSFFVSKRFTTSVLVPIWTVMSIFSTMGTAFPLALRIFGSSLRFPILLCMDCGISPTVMKLDPALVSRVTNNRFVYLIGRPMFAYTLSLRFENTNMTLGSVSCLTCRHGRCRKPIPLRLEKKDWWRWFVGDRGYGRRSRFFIIDSKFQTKPLASFSLSMYRLLLISLLFDSFIAKYDLAFLCVVSGTIKCLFTVRASYFFTPGLTGTRSTGNAVRCDFCRNRNEKWYWIQGWRWRHCPAWSKE